MASRCRPLVGVAWPRRRLGELLDAVARTEKLGATSSSSAGAEHHHASPEPADSTGSWIEWYCDVLGFEAEPTTIAYEELPSLLALAAPALLVLPGEMADGEGRAAPEFVAMLAASAGRARLLTPGGCMRSVPMAALLRRLGRAAEQPSAGEVDRLLDTAGSRGRRRRRARRALLDRSLADRAIDGIWLLRERPGAPFVRSLRRSGVVSRLAALVATHGVQVAVWLASWWLLGHALMQGGLAPGWLTAWLLLLATLVPLRLLGVWLQGDVAVRTGATVKQRLFAGALRLDPDELRRRGVGHHMGAVLECEALETQFLSGGMQGLLGGIELAFAVAVLSFGAASILQPLALLAWIAVALVLARCYLHGRSAWTGERLGLTHHLVETIVGHRTRVVQETHALRHEGEDRDLERYLRTSRRFDHQATSLATLVPRGWLCVALIALVPALVVGTTPARLAIALGGSLFAYRALARTTGGLLHLADASSSWNTARPLFQSAAGETSSDLLAPDGASGDPQSAVPILEARNLRHHYPGRSRPAVRDCGVEVRKGERILLTGPSGGGKSTLLGLLAGLRKPDEGLALLRGRDRGVTGSGRWRRKVALVAQDHENHIFSESLAFNLLLGRGWPPTRKDLTDCESLCHRLGLGELLGQMPAGLMQPVGENGWQLSAGERSRIMLARALLQDAEVVACDEGLAALGAGDAEVALRGLLREAPSLILTAHT